MKEEVCSSDIGCEYMRLLSVGSAAINSGDIGCECMGVLSVWGAGAGKGDMGGESMGVESNSINVMGVVSVGGAAATGSWFKGAILAASRAALRGRHIFGGMRSVTFGGASTNG
jgi:hypothetical protein